MTEVLSYRPRPEELAYTFGGRDPVRRVRPGTVLELSTEDCFGGLVRGVDDLPSRVCEFPYLNPVTGPFHIEGAEPGDTLAIEVLDLSTRGWGWTAILPGLGLLSEDFPDAYLRIFDLTAGTVAYLREDVAIPLEPFFGTMGVCPAGASEQPVMPPGTFGGNLDTRQLVAGTTLYLPVQVEGARFSCGDAHGAQGDGEVCVTGLESPMFASLRFRLERGRRLPGPQYRTAGPLTPRVDHAGFYGTTGVGGDPTRPRRTPCAR